MIKTDQLCLCCREVTFEVGEGSPSEKLADPTQTKGREPASGDRYAIATQGQCAPGGSLNLNVCSLTLPISQYSSFNSSMKGMIPEKSLLASYQKVMSSHVLS